MSTKDKIMESTFRLLLDKGHIEVSLSEIIEASQVGYGSIYYYFEDKDQLIQFVLNKYIIDMFFNQLDSIRLKDDLFSNLNNFYHKVLGLNEDNSYISYKNISIESSAFKKMILLTFEGQQKYEEEHDYFRKYNEKFAAIVREIIRCGIENKEIEKDIDIDKMAFFIKSNIYGIFFLWLVDDWTWLHSIPGNFLYVEDKTLVPVIAGIFESMGIGLCIKNGGSTGGTDIIALIVNKYWPVSLSGVFFVSDLIVVLAQLLLRPGFGSYAGDPKTFNDVMYGIIEIVTFALTIDLFTVGGKAKMQLFVFSEKYQDIADYVCNTMERGVTLLKSMGWYTKKEKNVLLILLTRQEVSKLSKVINDIDPKAFMSIGSAAEIYGEGFSEIKTGTVKLTKKKTED
mgnify:CR=1 FL=1